MSVIEMETTARTYKELLAAIKSLEDEADALKQQMIREMDNRQIDTLQAGIFEISYKLIESMRFNSKVLKEKMPKIAEQFTLPSVSTRFIVSA